jgi:hypothetical protein
LNTAKTIRRKLIGPICGCLAESNASADPAGHAEKIAGIAPTRTLGWNITSTCSCAFIAIGNLRGSISDVTTRPIAGRQLCCASSHRGTTVAGLTSAWTRWHSTATRARSADIGEQWRIVRNTIISRGTAAASARRTTAAAPGKAPASTTGEIGSATRETSMTRRKTAASGGNATARETAATSGKTSLTSREIATFPRKTTSTARKVSAASRESSTSTTPATASAGKQGDTMENEQCDDSRAQDEKKS